MNKKHAPSRILALYLKLRAYNIIKVQIICKVAMKVLQIKSLFSKAQKPIVDNHRKIKVEMKLRNRFKE